MRIKRWILALLLSPLIILAQKNDTRLQVKVMDLLRGFKGNAGIYIQNLKTKKTVSINADTLFPTASMVKIPIMIGIVNKLEKGTMTYHQELLYKDSLLYAGVDILGSFKNNEKIELSKLLLLMLATSDNTASLWLQTLAGSGLEINRLMDSLGFVKTRVNSRTPGREPDRNLYGWGQTTPREMATLLTKIYSGQIFNQSASGKMIRLLGRNYWDEVAISQIPEEIFVASKNGAVDDSRSEVLLVMAPHHPYVVCICTKNLQDKSWKTDNEAWLLTRRLSAMLWHYYEPKYRKPAVKFEN